MPRTYKAARYVGVLMMGVTRAGVRQGREAGGRSVDEGVRRERNQVGEGEWKSEKVI